MTEFEKEIWNRLRYVGFAFALCSFIAILQKYLELSRMEFLGTLATLSMGLLMIVMWSGFKGITNEMRSGFGELKNLLSKNPNSNPKNPDPKEEKEKIETKTSGAGAFGGMVIGGLLGLVLGPAGVVIGGLIGAAIGDQIERENVKAEKEKKKRKT